MLLFNRLRNAHKRGRRSDNNSGRPGAPSAGVHDDSGGGDTDGDNANHNTRTTTTRGVFASRITHLSSRFQRRRRNKRSGSSAAAVTEVEHNPSIEPLPRPILTPGSPRADDVVGDPLLPFSSVLEHALDDGSNISDAVPAVISSKIQSHHELWYCLAYGRPCDRRVSGGYGLVPASLAGKPLSRAQSVRGSGLTHITSWRSRPKHYPWASGDGWGNSAAEGKDDQHARITSIDYGNADEVVLARSQDVDRDLLHREDALPQGSPGFLVHPYDKRKLAWDISIAVLIIYGCVTIPLRIGFELDPSVGEKVADGVVDVMFFADMVVQFRTAFFAGDGEIVTDPREIAVRYLKTAFLLDLCSTVPIDLMLMSAGNSGGILRSTKLLRTLRLLRLARLLKLSNTIEKKDDDVGPMIHPSLWALIKMFVCLVFISHIMGCTWHWLAVLRPDDFTWVMAYGVENTSWGHRYLVCVYWAFTTMTTVGYGDITSASDVERCFAIVGMIIGATVFGYIIGNVAVIMENFDVVDAIETAKMNQIKDWLYDRKLPHALSEKIRRQYQYIFKEVSVFDSTEIVDVMPGVMSTSLLYAQHRAVAKGVRFLAKRPPVLVCLLLRRMVPCFATSGDVLYLEHEVGGHWYILRGGKVAFFISIAPLETNSEVVLMRTLERDGHFGHTALLLNVLSSETATARAATDLLTIRKDDLVDILQQWPEVMEELTTDADRLFREVKAFRASQLALRRNKNSAKLPRPLSEGATASVNTTVHMSPSPNPAGTGHSDLLPATPPTPVSAAAAGAAGAAAESASAYAVTTTPNNTKPISHPATGILSEGESVGVVGDRCSDVSREGAHGDNNNDRGVRRVSMVAEGDEDGEYEQEQQQQQLQGHSSSHVSASSAATASAAASAVVSAAALLGEDKAPEGVEARTGVRAQEEEKKEPWSRSGGIVSPMSSPAPTTASSSPPAVLSPCPNPAPGAAVPPVLSTTEAPSLVDDKKTIQTGDSEGSKKEMLDVALVPAAMTAEQAGAEVWATAAQPSTAGMGCVDTKEAADATGTHIAAASSSAAAVQAGTVGRKGAEPTAAITAGGSAVCAKPKVRMNGLGRLKDLRPSPIMTTVPTHVAPELLSPSTGEAVADAAVGRDPSEPQLARGCFIAKSFSPSDLGLGEASRGRDGDEYPHRKDPPHDFWATLSVRQRRPRAGRKRSAMAQNIRRGTAEEVFGIDEAQAALGSVPPDRLFSVTGMIHPEASIKVAWDLWVSTVIIWSVLEVTFRLGFDRPAHGGWVAFSYFVDVTFFSDMVVSFRTALLTKDGVVIAHPKQAACAYLKGWFFVDLVSTVPWDLLVLQIAVGNPSAATSTKLIRALRLARLVRLLRLLKIPDFMEEWEMNSPLGPSSVRLGRLLVIMLFSAHINACVWFAAGLNTSAGRSWIEDYYCAEDGTDSACPESKTSLSLYLVSIYFAFTTMTTTGYGDILPNRESAEELLVAIASEVIGATIFAWVIGNLVTLVLNLDPAQRNRKSMMNYLTEYMRELPLSAKAKKNVARNYAFHLQIHSVFNQPSIMGDLLPHLQNQVYVFLWRGLLPKLPFLCSMEDQVTGFFRVIVPLLKPATFAVGDLITTPKVGTREMSFIVSGEVEVRLAKGRRDFKQISLGEGKHFGEMMVLLPEHVPFRGLAQVRALSRVRMMQFTRGSFSVLEGRHPHVSSFMTKQLFEPDTTPSWVVVSADFQSEVDKLAAMAAVSKQSTLQTPRTPEGTFRDECGNEEDGLRSPGGTLRKSPLRSPPASPVGVSPPREPGLRSAVVMKTGVRLSGNRQPRVK